MNDRNTLHELYEIVSSQVSAMGLELATAAMPVVKAHFGMECDVYFRRRLSVCRMLVDLHLPIDNDRLDVLIACALSHSLPGDNVPEDYPHTMARLTVFDRRVTEVMSTLRQTSYSDMSYYENLISNRYALLIRLTERSVLLETLYEWSPKEARGFLEGTRESFFPMCIYAKEHYPEFLGAATVLMEKTRSLLMANEALLTRYEETENALKGELLSLSEENAAIRSMMLEMKQE